MKVELQEVDLPTPMQILKFNGRVISIDTLISIANTSLDALEQMGVVLDYKDNIDDGAESMSLDEFSDTVRNKKT